MLNDQQMNMLMARGRDYMGLMKTLPGVVPVNDPAVLQQPSAPSAVNGVRGGLTTQAFFKAFLPGLATSRVLPARAGGGSTEKSWKDPMQSDQALESRRTAGELPI